MDVFLSRPTDGSPKQMSFCRRLVRHLEEHGFVARSVGTSDFGNDAPLISVQALISKCCSAVVLGLTQLYARDCTRKPGSKFEATVGELALPTAWNQLEAGMAYMAGLPLLVVKEEGLSTDGIFDPGVSEYFVHEASLTAGWLQSPQFIQPFKQWAEAVRQATPLQ